MKPIIDHIIYGLTSIGESHYITVVDCDGDKLKIRSSNHSCNSRNNGDIRTLSFVTQKTPAKFLGGALNEEWVMEYDEDKEEWNTGSWNYQTIEEILSDYCIVAYQNYGETINL